MNTKDIILELRTKKGLSQDELAEKLHVTDKAVSRWETGRGMPSVDLLEPLADVLGLSVSELLSGKRLAAEELPKEAGGQIVDSMKRNTWMLWKGVLTAAVFVFLMADISTEVGD